MMSKPMIMLYWMESWELDVSSTLNFQNISFEVNNLFSLKVISHICVVLSVHTLPTYFEGFLTFNLSIFNMLFIQKIHHFLNISTLLIFVCVFAKIFD